MRAYKPWRYTSRQVIKRMAEAASRQVVSRHTTLRLLAVLTVVLAPHVPHVPLWATALVVAVGLWRAGAAARGWQLPGLAVRGGLAAAATGGVYLSFGTLNGQTPGVTLLALMGALKLTEMRGHRDHMVMIMLAYFLLVTHFLFNQEVPMIAFLLLCAVLITAMLTEINHPQGPLPARQTLRSAGVMVAQAIPLMIVLFILFPRIPGPLWGLPSDSGANAVTGLSDSMSPGDITNLSQSDAVAFRARFDGPLPPPNQRYWRGPVLWDFDGRTWTRGEAANYLPPARLSDIGDPVGYEVILEVSRKPWLLALDVPTQAPANGVFSAGLSARARRPIYERKLYRSTAYTQYTLDAELSQFTRNVATRLPSNRNPDSIALAQQWRDSAGSDTAFIDRVLQYFRAQPFVYTLQPPALGRHTVDDFLFNTRRGFCGHYSSAFVTLMRAAGLPARVVTGYQGGEPNGDYFTVRQSDAHAWAEVWLNGRGWVRIDPTAAVSPERVELGLGAALPAGEPVPGLARRTGAMLENLQLRWELVNAAWNRWVLAYGPEMQREILSRFGLGDWRSMIFALVAAVTVLLGVVGVWALWQTRPARNNDQALRLWNQVSNKLRKHGLERAADEGPRDYTDRVVAQRPDLAEPMQRILRAYLQARYFSTDGDLSQLREAVAAFKT